MAETPLLRLVLSEMAGWESQVLLAHTAHFEGNLNKSSSSSSGDWIRSLANTLCALQLSRVASSPPLAEDWSVLTAGME